MSKEKIRHYRIRTRFCRKIVYVHLCVFFFAAAPTAAHSSLQVKWQDGRITVIAEKVPQYQVLQEVASKAGMQIRNLQGLQDKVSVHLMYISLREGIRQLLPNVNYCLQEGNVPKKAGQLIFLSASGQQAVALPGALAGDEQQAAEDEDAEERLTELYALAEQGDEGALRKATSDSNPTIGQTAFALLAKLNPVGAADMATVASRSSKLEQQYTGLQALGGLDDPRALQVLGESLANEDMGIREFAVRGLTNQTDPSAIRFLNQALKDPEPSIRMLALEGLAGRGVESRGALTLALQSNDADIQARAAELLEQITANEAEVIPPSLNATIFSNDSN